MEDRNDEILQLPMSVVGRVDVGRLIREVDALGSFLEAQAIRQPETAASLPRTSRLLDEIIQFNKLHVLNEADRNRLAAFLVAVRAQAPVLHISFSADPTPFFVQRLITWLRQDIHPLVLLQLGLQPTIGAGCIVRTTNKYFDLSLRKRFAEKRGVLVKRLHDISQQPAAAPKTVVRQEAAS